MRLIDADLLITEFDERCAGDCCCCSRGYCPIFNQPTAYDIDKVIEKLKELPHGKYKDDFGKGYSLAINICVEIVEQSLKNNL